MTAFSVYSTLGSKDRPKGREGNELTIASKRLADRRKRDCNPRGDFVGREKVAARQQVIHLETFLSLSVPSRVEAIILSRGGKREGGRGAGMEGLLAPGKGGPPSLPSHSVIAAGSWYGVGGKMRARAVGLSFDMLFPLLVP